LVRRIHVPLPDAAAREALLRRTLRGASFELPARELARLVAATDRYSGSDLAALCREAALAPLRELGDALATAPASRVRPLAARDFDAARRVIRPSVGAEQLAHFAAWDAQFGRAP
jgi:spastin